MQEDMNVSDRAVFQRRSVWTGRLLGLLRKADLGIPGLVSRLVMTAKLTLVRLLIDRESTGWADGAVDHMLAYYPQG